MFTGVEWGKLPACHQHTTGGRPIRHYLRLEALHLRAASESFRCEVKSTARERLRSLQVDVTQPVKEEQMHVARHDDSTVEAWMFGPGKGIAGYALVLEALK